jgi:molybdenum cofactor cytidylyltransferase
MSPLIDDAGTANGDAASIGVIILAAGGGSRFGSLKQVARVRGQPLIVHAVRAAEGVPAPAPIVVVLGCGAELVRGELPGRRERVVVCPDWRDGVASSLRCGLHALGDQDAVLVLLADQPLIDAALVRTVLKIGLPRVLAGSWPAAAPSGAQVDAPDAARPVSDGVPGHPVLLGPGALARLHALEPDRGMVAVLAPGRVYEIPVDGPAATLDVDVPSDLARAEQAA